jgi:hypothetical protein
MSFGPGQAPSPADPRAANPGRAPSGPDALARELGGLIAILESHFSYEERRIAKALDTLGPLAWTAAVFAPGQTPAR